MKQFSCGDVIPGCSRVFRAQSDQEILAQVASHAGSDHQMSVVPDSLVQQVRERILVTA